MWSKIKSYLTIESLSWMVAISLIFCINRYIDIKQYFIRLVHPTLTREWLAETAGFLAMIALLLGTYAFFFC